MDDITILRTHEQIRFDDAGTQINELRVSFKVGNDGPFMRVFPREGFSAVTAKLDLEAFARELRQLRQG